MATNNCSVKTAPSLPRPGSLYWWRIALLLILCAKPLLCQRAGAQSTWETSKLPLGGAATSTVPPVDRSTEVTSSHRDDGDAAFAIDDDEVTDKKSVIFEAGSGEGVGIGREEEAKKFYKTARKNEDVAADDIFYDDFAAQSDEDDYDRYLSDEEQDGDDDDDGYEDFKDKMQADFVPVSRVKESGAKKGMNPTSRRKKKKKTRHQDFQRDFNLADYSNEYRIKQLLLQYYDKTTRPVRNDSTTTALYIGMSLYHILDTNEKYQTLSALIAVRLRWVDEYLNWDPAEFGGLEKIWIPAMRIWTPDIFINNFADDSFQDFMDTFAIVTYTGEVLWMFPAVVKTYCTLDVRHFPFDHQKCAIIFISWTFHGFKVNLTYHDGENNAIYYKPKNQEWYVENLTVFRHEAIYACCPEPYPDVTFTIHMTRRSLFYIINLIFPCLLIYAVSFLGFFLPVESGEKVNLEITILLALVVFLLIVGETLPPTPDAIPALGLLFGLTMIMVSIALVMAVIVTNVYLRKDSGKRVPACLRRILLRNVTRKTSLTNKVTVAENHVNDNNSKPAHSTLVPEIELDNLSMLSEMETLTCPSRVVRRKSTFSRSAGCGTPLPHHYGGSLHELNADTMEKLDRYAYEWQKLARLVDRAFFWLFLFASIGALTTVFAKVPQYNTT